MSGASRAVRKTFGSILLATQSASALARMFFRAGNIFANVVVNRSKVGFVIVSSWADKIEAR
jgi:hypothetical protein